MHCESPFEHVDAEPALRAAPATIDPVLTRSVHDALVRDPLVLAGRIRVSAAAGWVTLEGDVDYDAQKRDAETAVRGVPGVVGVINEITVEVPVFDGAPSRSPF